jgi:preprotein translocase subunit SecY
LEFISARATEQAMWEKIRVMFTIPELRNKILLTMGFLAIYRVGFQIPLPIVDAAYMKSAFQQSSSGFGSLFQQAAVFSATNLTMGTIFGLGIMPYISASIIFQLLGSVWGPLERLQKEGESGRKKINEYTRYATVVICIGQSWGYLAWLIHGDGHRSYILPEFLTNGHLSFWWQFVAVMTMTTGTIFLMWLGEQIDEFGIGNGISLLIMAGILARMPGAFIDMIKNSSLELGGSVGKFGPEKWIVMGILFVSVVAGVVYMTQGQRRIPTQSAKHVRGRRVFGGTKQYLPLRVNHSGVMPIIFASSLLLFPNILFRSMASAYGGVWDNLNEAFTRGTSYIYNVSYVVLIFFFCYFWTAIMFNPKDVADNLKDFGTFVPGYRPGKRTEDYLEKVMVRITYVGAAFLAVVAIVPTLVSGALEIPFTISQFYGGTTLLIAVSVAFDLVQKIDSHLVMRNYKGLLE